MWWEIDGIEMVSCLLVEYNLRIICCDVSCTGVCAKENLNWNDFVVGLSHLWPVGQG